MREFLHIKLFNVMLGTFIVPFFCFAQKVSPPNADAKIYQAIDSIYTNLYFNDYNNAIKAFDTQLKIATTNKRWHIVLNVLTLKAKCAFHHNIFTAILPTLREAEQVEKEKHAILETLDSTYLVRSQIFNVRGIYHYTLGNFIQAIKNFETIIKINKTYNSIDLINLRGIYMFIGYSYFEMMLYDKAYMNYEQASALLPKEITTDYLYQQAMGDLFKGKCKEFKALHMKDSSLVKEALQMYRHAFKILISIRREVKNQNALRSAYIRIAAAHSILKNYDSALYYLKTSFVINKDHEYKTFIVLGDLYKEQKKFSQATSYYLEAYDKVVQVYPEKHFEKSIPLIKKAEVQMLTQDYSGALKTCQLGLTLIVKEFNDARNILKLPIDIKESNLSLLLDCTWLKAKIFFNWSQHGGPDNYLEESLKTYQYAIGIISEMQNNYPESTYKQDLAAKVHAFYEDALNAIYEANKKDGPHQNHINLFFALLEANKNTVLRESFNSTYAHAFTHIPQSILDQEIFLKGLMASLKRKIYESPYDSTQHESKTKLYKLSLQYDSLITIIKSGYPAYYQLKHAKNEFKLTDLKKPLDTKTVVVEFFWGDENLFIMAVGKNKHVVKKITNLATLATEVRTVLQHIHDPFSKIQSSTTTFINTSYNLYSKLLGSVLANWKTDNIQSLVIIPDGLLCYLPFDILITSRPSTQQAVSYHSLPYLLNTYTIRNLFAASFIKSSTSPGKFTYSYVGFAPGYSKSEPLPTSNRNASKPTHLTHNEAEVGQASGYFNGKTIVGNEATETTFRNMAQQAKILHLSMHAFTNDYDPSYSGLAFTPQDSAKEENDGLMHLYELYNLPINADLTVLSACETGAGKYARGEGIMSLGRAFRYAGCENIVMSLWKVNDKATTEIMTLFFQNLKAGMDKDEALRQAKIKFLSSPQNKYFTHPYYWSAFIISGDPSPVVNSPFNWINVAIITFVFLVTLLIFLYRRKLLASVR